jgi:hypothetical protein
VAGSLAGGAAYSSGVSGNPARWPVSELHRHFCSGLGDHLSEWPPPSDMMSKPLRLRAVSPLPPRLIVYLFNATDHPSERRAGDYRIQLRLPGQRPRSRGNLESAPGSMLVLAGYIPEFDTYVMWDATAHSEFPYSKGVQVAARTVHEAAIEGIAEQIRLIRSAGVTEHVVAARTDHLVRALIRRHEITRDDLLLETQQYHTERSSPRAGSSQGELW